MTRVRRWWIAGLGAVLFPSCATHVTFRHHGGAGQAGAGASTGGAGNGGTHASGGTAGTVAKGGAAGDFASAGGRAGSGDTTSKGGFSGHEGPAETAGAGAGGEPSAAGAGGEETAGLGGGAGGPTLTDGDECQSDGECQSGNCSADAALAKRICCQSGFSNCGSCVDLQSDASKCGSCSNVCGANEACNSGKCRCSGYTFPETCGGGCGTFAFESGTPEGWFADTDPGFPVNGGDNNGTTNVTTTSIAAHVHDGGNALAVPGLTDGSTVVSVAVPVCRQGASVNMAGFTLSAWVYLTGTDLSSLSFLFFDAWGPSGVFSSPVLTGDKITVLNTWYQLSATFASTIQADHVAIRLNPNAAWTGTMYIDSVSITGP